MSSYINEHICINYPGYVQNVPKALHTLGGLETISNVNEETNRRLELR